MTILRFAHHSVNPMHDDIALETRNLVKEFHGKPAVNGVNLRVPSGGIYGFIGPNGSGKSTTMKMLLGLTRPTSGTIEVLGGPLNRQSMTRVGSIIEQPPGYGHLTGLENMRVVRDMLKLDDASTNAALETVGLWAERNKLVRNFSLGMKQRLGIAIALAREPDLLILDEPIKPKGDTCCLPLQSTAYGLAE